MKTTVELPDDLLLAAKRKALETRTNLARYHGARLAAGVEAGWRPTGAPSLAGFVG